jgi:hypothetical protein
LAPIEVNEVKLVFCKLDDFGPNVISLDPEPLGNIKHVDVMIGPL